MPTRRSIKDRNRQAIAADPLVAPASPVVDEAAAPVPTPAAAPRQPAKRRTPAAPVAASSSTGRIGIYLTAEQFAAAKGAYLADWQHGGEADTFARWIGAAIEEHAARTPKQRATAQPKGRAEVRTGSTRSFSIPTDTLARMRAAIVADNQAGRFPSDSAWCGEAIDRATDAARAAAGGTLPTPPPRLPNRLTR